MLQEFSNMLTDGITYILNEYKSTKENPDFTTLVKDVTRTVNLRISLVIFYNHVKTGFSDVMEEKSNQQEVNNKLVAQLQLSQQQSTNAFIRSLQRIWITKWMKLVRYHLL